MAEGPVNLLTDLFTQEGIKEFPFILDIGTVDRYMAYTESI